ncbi:ORF66 [Ranid herpesvirus 2]|uniref:ORF66 n=1 Tax=Ranid herpesvirus 2 TaxID=389214 RepID=Q14W40_9VIRU|nr:ORF66 [Ranid herpesvirus 2]ABG25694.1 ORF66 [Ranid herpesvirus 2]
MSSKDELYVFHLNPLACVTYNYYHFFLGFYKNADDLTYEDLIEISDAEFNLDFEKYSTALFPRVYDLLPHERICIICNETVRVNVACGLHKIVMAMGGALSADGQNMNLHEPHTARRYVMRYKDTINQVLKSLSDLGFEDYSDAVIKGLQQHGIHI